MGNGKTEIPDYSNQSQAAKILGISRMTVWQWLKEGRIQAVNIGGFRMIPKSELEKLKKEINKEAAEA